MSPQSDSHHQSLPKMQQSLDEQLSERDQLPPLLYSPTRERGERGGGVGEKCGKDDEEIKDNRKV